MFLAFYICVLNPDKKGYDESNEIRTALKPICQSFDILLKDATDYHRVGSINEQVMQAIMEADIVFADANESNENVWYEIGYADNVNLSKVICLSREGKILPFDRANIRSIQYKKSKNGKSEFAKKLDNTIEDILISNSISQIITQQGKVLDGELAIRNIASRLENEKLRAKGSEWLITSVGNEAIPMNDRIIYLRTLKRAGILPSELYISLTKPHVEPGFRNYIFTQLNISKEVVKSEVWDNSIAHIEDSEDISPQMECIIYHRLNGALTQDWFEEKILKSSVPKIRNSMYIVVGKMLEKSDNEQLKVLVDNGIKKISDA